MRKIVPAAFVIMSFLLGCSAAEDDYVQQLIDAMQHEDVGVRWNVAMLLAKTGDKRAIEPLKGLWKEDSYKPLQIFAACALAGLTEDDKALDFLIDGLKDKDVDVRVCASGALARIGDEKAVEPLAKLMKHDEDKRVQLSAAFALVYTNRDEQALEFLLKMLKDKDREIRHVAADVLGGIDDKEVIEALVQAFKDEAPVGALTKENVTEWHEKQRANVREKIAESLVRIGKPAIVYLGKALKDSDSDVRSFAAWTLGMIAEKEVVEPLVEALKDKDKDVRCTAASALGNIGESAAVDSLVEILKDKEVRRWAISALGEIGDRKAVKPLIDTLKDKNSEVRFRVTLALCDIADKSAVGTLRKVWKDDTDKEVQIGGALGVFKLAGDNEAFKFMVEGLSDKQTSVRLNAIYVLGESGDSRAVQLLAEILEESEVPLLVVQALRKLKHKETVAPLIKALKHYGSSALEAVEALGEMRDKRAIAPLIETLEWLNIEDQPLRITAALESITEDDFGDNYAKWQQWYEKNRDK